MSDIATADRLLFILGLSAVAIVLGGCPAKPSATTAPGQNTTATPPATNDAPAIEPPAENPPDAETEVGAANTQPVAEQPAPDAAETKKLIAWLREIGANVEQNEAGDILSLVLGFTEFGDDDVQRIVGLPKLEFLSVDHTNISDKGVQALAPLQSLKTLNLSSNSLTGAGVAAAAKLTILEHLDLSELPVDDKTLASLGGLKKLKDLNLTDTKVSLEGTIAFAMALPELEVSAPFGRLIGGTRLTMDPSVVDADLARLKSLSTLRELNLWECDQVTNAGIAHVKELKQLTSLELGFTKINNDGLESLAALANLKQLDLRETNTSMAATLQLVAKLPALRVLADWGEVRGAKSLTLASTATDDQLAYVRHLPNLQSLSLWRCDLLTDAALPPLAKLQALRELNLGATNVGDDGLAVLEQLPQLERLVLTNTPITDKGLTHIGKLTNLQSLDLSSTGVTDAGLKELAGLQQLESLSLAGTAVTNVGLNDISVLQALTSLDLEETRVGVPLDDSDAGQEGLGSLANLPQLRRLLLSLTTVDDWAIAQLTALPAVEEIDLWGTAITDESIDELARLKQLKQIGLVATSISPEAIVRLQRDLPNAKILVAISEPQQDN